MVKFFLKSTNSNEVEALWGFTPMHIAANAGNLPLIKMLLTYGASIYRKCHKGRTPEDVAREAGYEEVTEFLMAERFAAPAQLAFKDPHLNLNIWIGDFNALDPTWTTDVGINEVVCTISNIILSLVSALPLLTLSSLILHMQHSDMYAVPDVETRQRGLAERR